VTDILKKLYAGSITPNEAQKMLDEVLDSEGGGAIGSLLKIGDVEWTAYGHGAQLEEIARWRYDGWPTRCAVCGRKIHADLFGWLIMQYGGRSALRHVGCRTSLMH
jgi:hypothetical protein